MFFPADTVHLGRNLNGRPLARLFQGFLVDAVVEFELVKDFVLHNAARIVKAELRPALG